MKRIILSFCLMLNLSFFAQQWDWAKNILNTYSDYPPLLEANSYGDVFTTSVFESNGSYAYNIRTIKHTNTGQVVWTKTIGTPYNSYAFTRDLTIDNNNIYILGFFVHNINFANTTISSNTWKSFIACYGQDGTEKWIKDFPLFTNWGNTMTIDSNGDLIYANYTNYPTNYLSINKLSSNGNVVWTKTFLTLADVNDVSCDSQNNIYLAGNFTQNQLMIDSTIYYNDTGFYFNSYLAKLEPTGEIMSVEIIKGTTLNTIEIDSSDNIFVSGNYYHDGMKLRQKEFSPIIPCSYNCNKFFIAKLNTEDSCSWIKIPVSGSGTSFTLSNFGEPYVYGQYLSFDTIQTSGELKVVKFNPYGEILWEHENNGNYMSSCTAKDISSSNNSLFFTGSYQSNQFYLNTKVWFGSDTLPYTGYTENIFLAKLTDDQIVTSIDVDAKKNKDGITIYPNPSTGIFTINDEFVSSKICIYDILGNCLWAKECKYTNNQKIDLSTQPKGIYFLEVTTESERSVSKICVQ